MAAIVKSEPLESNIYPQKEHCHRFYFDCPTHKMTNQEITCTEPGTILRALETHDSFKAGGKMDKKTLKGKDIVIKSCKGYIVKHFPCWLIKEDDRLTVEIVTHEETEGVTDETAGVTDAETDNYVTFYIETTGRKFSKTKPIRRNKQSKGPVCIYAKQKEEVEKALRNDGRFSNIVFEQKCQLSERLTGINIAMGQIAKYLHDRNFVICLTKIKERTNNMDTSDSTIKTTVNSKGDSTPTSLYDPSPDSNGDSTPTSLYDPSPDSNGDSTPTSLYDPSPDSNGDSTQTSLFDPSPDSKGDSTPTSLYDPSPDSKGDSTPTSLYDPSPDSKGDSTQMSQSKRRTETSDAGEYSSRRKQKRKCNPMPDQGEIWKILRNQFDGLVKQMESRWEESQKKTFPQELNLMKQEFGKIRPVFSEVHRVKKLIKLGDSVCQVIVDGVQDKDGNVQRVQGTGFVLFDNFILTNAHLFGKNLRDNMQLIVDVSVVFNYEDPTGLGVNVMKAKALLIDFEYGDQKNYYMDYAILEIHPLNKKQQKRVPPGLLREYGPVPAYGGACLIGHPSGLVKQIEPTSIIGSEIREEAVKKYKRENGHAIFTINYATKENKKRFEEVMQEKTDFVTYNTSFFYGSSGSPVFNNFGKVFGIHTGGFSYEDKRTQSTQSVIEYALPLLPILKNFVIRLKEDDKQEVLKRVQEEAQKNRILFHALFKNDGDEPMDES